MVQHPHGPLERLLADCQDLMSGSGEAALAPVAARALEAYAELDDAARLTFFTALVEHYDVDPDRVREAYQRWETASADGTAAEETSRLFDVVEPARQQLLRRMNYAPLGTLGLVRMRADVRTLLRRHPQLRPLDHDLHHLLSSWFNRGFLRMVEVETGSPEQVQAHLLHYERVHPMVSREELRRRIDPADRRVYAFFHPATGDVPLVFVEVALVAGAPDRIEPLLAAADGGTARTAVLDPAAADTAALYSINNALDGLAGVHFGAHLIKQVVEQISSELPHVRHFVTLSPIPGFRRWLEDQAGRDHELATLWEAVREAARPAALDGDVRPALLAAVERYLTVEVNDAGRPVDPVARFHLGNGATAWRLNWAANHSSAAWEQSFGVMINYRYPGVSAPQHDALERGNSTMNQDFTSIYEAFVQHASQDPERVLFHLEDGSTRSYGDTLSTARRIASQLAADGVLRGDRVAVQVEKSPEAVALYLATLQLGAVFLPLNTAYTGSEIDYFVGDAEPRVFVCSPGAADDHAHRASEALTLETLSADGAGSLLDAAEERTETATVGPDDLASILYTSGTTGRSKGAMLTHGNLASNCAALLDEWRYTSADRLIHALPIFHIHGLFVAANMTLVAGASMDFLTKFDAEKILNRFEHATVLMGVPTFYTRLLANERLTAEACSSMRLFVSGSAPLLASDHEAFAERTGHAILERYGMTETGMNASNPYSGDRKPGTVGLPLPGVELRVTDRETGQTLPDGEVGLLEVRGPNVFAGYWRMPEKTAAEFREDGFFITGDMARIDSSGYVSIVGRDKDLIISGGFNVYPKEIEVLLDACDGVLESAVVGVPHPDFGETVVAVLVPQPGQELDGEAIVASISGDLARFKQPRAVRVVDALPRNVMGKVQKAQLRATYAELFTGVSA
ncbi:AMP-binding protein [Zhihengliuella flava]|uniref:Acyl-CoA synthetase (AMP-forming)/AMP-acid ligase II n=1 Tax=Zhihengliuella flava TaxID=1285193 RepID=A0A931GIP9_9MICC|nr:AMP-binding protein [Zhihengliuella flava]MBG6084501.1 acyl-CoA synthetase (AMP-forming)/AMP-acid ligase II [Zhihengliuella flava]